MANVASEAGAAYFDLNTDPDHLGLTGYPEWQPFGGVSDSGCIRLTDNTNQTGAVLFPDIDGGLAANAFALECMLALGDWYGNPPGYGFSVNFARGTDPVNGLIDIGTNPGRGGRTNGWAGNQDIGGTEINLPEEGTQTGIAIGFHTWGRGNPPVGGSDGSNDVRRISVRVDGNEVARIPMPDILFADGDNHNYTNDATTLVTGPFSNGGDPNGPAVMIGGVAMPAYGNPDNGDGTVAPPAPGRRLNWCQLKVSVDETGLLNLWWKGSNVVQNLQTSWSPGTGRIVFGAGTGSAMEYVAIVNVVLTTVSVPPKFNTPTISGADITITWTGLATLLQASALTGQASDWTLVIPQPTGNSYTVTGAISGNKFYRLKH